MIKVGDTVKITGGPHAGKTGEVTDVAGAFLEVGGVGVHGGQVEKIEPKAGPAEPEPDLKPRGVKRQWHLMPLDALGYVMQVCDGLTLHTLECLADYQTNPGAETAARMVGALLRALQEDRGSLSDALDLTVQVFEHGAEKYTADNWRSAATDRDSFRLEYLSAICRHVFAPEAVDPESGHAHLAHAVCGGLMIVWHERSTFS